mmetsp:Transcript_16451/g.33708  ORF Transcript_16451/g.33708 Transcript_16451/m.33708 type:complete len:233 (-) Transcript_16451:71-769(-)
MQSHPQETIVVKSHAHDQLDDPPRNLPRGLRHGAEGVIPLPLCGTLASPSSSFLLLPPFDRRSLQQRRHLVAVGMERRPDVIEGRVLSSVRGSGSGGVGAEEEVHDSGGGTLGDGEVYRQQSEVVRLPRPFRVRAQQQGDRPLAGPVLARQVQREGVVLSPPGPRGVAVRGKEGPQKIEGDVAGCDAGEVQRQEGTSTSMPMRSISVPVPVPVRGVSVSVVGVRRVHDDDPT